MEMRVARLLRKSDADILMYVAIGTTTENQFSSADVWLVVHFFRGISCQLESSWNEGSTSIVSL
jgi:hypothetical protein